MYGYALPPEQIVPACAETLDGLLSFLQIKQGIYEKFDHVYQNSVKSDPGPLSLFFNFANSVQKDVLTKVYFIAINILFVVLTQE